MHVSGCVARYEAACTPAHVSALQMQSGHAYSHPVAMPGDSAAVLAQMGMKALTGYLCEACVSIASLFACDVILAQGSVRLQRDSGVRLGKCQVQRDSGVHAFHMLMPGACLFLGCA